MKLCRFDADQLGVVEGDVVRNVTSVLQELPACRYPLPRGDLLIRHLPELRPAIEAALPSAPSIPLADVRLLSPVANPGKIVAAPVNYQKHLQEARDDAEIHHQNQVEEIQRVGLFLKANSSLIGPSQPVVIAHPERRNDHEIELVCIIGKTARNISREQALEHVAGYCLGLDMTTRGPEERSLRKSIDTYTVLGPWLTTADELTDPSAIGMELRVNGELRQHANTRDLIIELPDLIAFASRFYTLEPGDVLFTGTPEGVNRVAPGDIMLASADGLGSMEVRVQ